MLNDIKKLISSFKNANRGIKQTYEHERNFRIHIVATIYVLIFAIIGQVTKVELMILIICIALMLGAELVNTAFERLCDENNQSGYNKSVKDAKDIAAGAVLITALFCVFVAFIIFIEKTIFMNIIEFFASKLWALGIFIASVPILIYFAIRGEQK